MKRTARSPRRSRTRAASSRSHRFHPKNSSPRVLCFTLARLMVALRDRAGLTQEELAERAGVSLSDVRAQETAAATADLKDFITLCFVLGFDFICVMYEAGRRMEAAGTPFLEGTPVRPTERFVDERCSGKSPMPREECLRQLCFLEALILPDTPVYEAPKRTTRPRRVKM